jgi:ribosomal protein L13E
MQDAIKRGIVKRVTNGVIISRHGRGYSKYELVQSGVTDIRIGSKRKIPIDPFRKTAHNENIEQLKAYFSKEISKTTSKVKQKRIRKTPRNSLN